MVDLFLCPCIKRHKSHKNNYLELDNKEMKFEEIRFVTKSLQCFKYIYNKYQIKKNNKRKKEKTNKPTMQINVRKKSFLKNNLQYKIVNFK